MNMYDNDHPATPEFGPAGPQPEPPPLPPAGATGPPPLPPAPPTGTAPPSERPAGQVWRGSTTSSRGCLIGGIATVILFALSVVLGILLVPAVADIFQMAHRTTCETQLRALYALLEEQAAKNGGEFPELASGESYMMFGGPLLSTVDLSLLQCPGESTNHGERLEDGTVFTDSDYVYAGYAIREQADLERLAEALHERGGDWSRVREDVRTGALQGLTPLRADLDDAASLPLLIEWPEFHEDGVNVLYLDGHIEFVPFGEKFPVTDEFFEAMDDIGELQR